MNVRAPTERPRRVPALAATAILALLGAGPAPDDPAVRPAQADATPAPGVVRYPANRAAEAAARPDVIQQPSARPGTSDLGPGTLDRVLGLDPDESPVTLYGWLQNSFTGNTLGTPRNDSNVSVFPNRLANRWQGNQYYLVAENPIDPESRLDLGFRLDTLFGNDWQFTKSYGLFDRAFTPNGFAGVDFPQVYGTLHVGLGGGRTFDVKGGRFYSPAGYEGVMATQRPLLSVANALNFTPFTFFGVQTTLRLSDRLELYNGAVNGWDRWINQNYRWNYLGGFNLALDADARTTLRSVLVTGPNQLPRFAPADSPFLPTGVVTTPQLQRRVNPLYPTQWRTYLSNVLTRRWSDRLTQAGEVFFVVEPNVPGLGPGGRPKDSSWYGFAHWFLYAPTPKVTAVWRVEIFRDTAGAAIGTADTFYAMTLGLLTKPKPWLWFRPEARYDWAQFKTPYLDGTRGSQLTLAFDVVVLF
jgi:hypothetical protein